jgi:hypothetical protein
MHSRAEEFLQVFKKGAEFTQGLLKENERLRFRVLELEQQQRSEASDSDMQLIKERLLRVETEKQEILDKIGSVERENLDYSNRYAEIEAENNLLANLYITTYQLHSTFEVSEILRIIEEILLNLVGAEEFSLFLRDEGGQMVQPIIDDAGDPQVAEVEIKDARIATALGEGQSWIASPDELKQLGETEAKAIIPLLADDDVIGVLTIHRLLAQKDGFSDTDNEIFTLLGGHAAMALCTAVLRQENVGRINFRQSFLPQR